MTSISATLLAIALAEPAELHGTTVCPSPEQVRVALGALLPAGQAVTPAGTVGRLLDEPAGVRVVLEDAGGRRLAERRLPPSKDCAALAAAAAVAVAVWQQGLPEVDLRGGANRQGAAAAGAGGVGMLAAAGEPPGRLALAFGAGGSASVAPIRGRQPGAAVGLLLLTRARVEPLPVAGQLLLEAQSARVFSLSSGQVHARRVTAGVGVEASAALSARLRAGGQIAVHGAHLSLRGSSFASNLRSSAWDAGLGAGARLLYAGGAFIGWLDLGARVWPRPRTAALSRLDTGLALPALEAGIAGGVGLGRL